MFDDRIGNLQKMLARMGPEGRQKYAADHADDPIAVSMALFVNNIAKEIKEGKRGEPDMPPPVVQQAIQSMTQPQMPQGGPPQQGPPQGVPPQDQPQGMPPQGMPQQGPPPQDMPPPQGQPQMAADGGYMDSRLPEDMGIGALPERSLSNMADGGIVGYAFGGTPKGSRQPSFDNALEIEGITDPKQQAFLKALYGKESGSGANTTTSNRGAVGGMQILPGTFDEVADRNMDINNPFDNMRAGIRYGMQGYKAAKGDPVLAGAYYYSGPDGFKDAVNNIARVDTKNPKYPNSLEYGRSIAKTMTALLPMGSAQAETTAPSAAPAPADVPSIYSGEGYTEAGLEALGKRLDIIREARSRAKPVGSIERKADPDAPQRYDALIQLNKDAQKEYESYAEKMGLNKPAFLAPAGGGKSVGTTTIPFVQQVAKEAAKPASNEPDAYPSSPNETMSLEDQRAQYGRGKLPLETDSSKPSSGEEADLRGKSGIADLDIGPKQPPITPEIAKTAVALAKDEIPKKEQSGFGYEDLMMFGLNLMAGQSSNALTNVGTAGIAALTARQARAKAEADKRKSESEALRDTAYGEYYKDKIAQGPEERRLAAEDKKLAAEDRRTRIANETQDRANALARQREADQVTRQAKADDALKDSKEYNRALMEAQIARFAFDKISDPTQEQKDKFLRSQEIPRMIKREAYKGFGINPLGSNTSSAGWNIAPAP